MLKIQFKDRRKPAMWLVDSTLKIGSKIGCEIRIDEAKVDPIHVELEIQQDDVLLRNVSNNRSVFVNDLPIVKEHNLKVWDVIRVGESELEIVDPLNDRNPKPKAIKKESQKTVISPVVSPWMLKAESAPLKGQYFSLKNDYVIGRDEKADIKLPFSYISRQHVKVILKNSELYIEDLNSSNGTYVNGNKVSTAELANGDELRLDQCIFHVIGPSKKENTTIRTVVRGNPTRAAKATKKVSAENDAQPIRVFASKKVFLHGLSGHAMGKVFEITHVNNHISRLLGHHLSTSEISVSARHVYLSETEVGWQIKNDGASDGLVVNGKMQSKVVLADGDEIVVGGSLLKFQSEGDQPLSFVEPEAKKSNKLMPTFILLAIAVAAAGVYFSGVIS